MIYSTCYTIITQMKCQDVAPVALSGRDNGYASQRFGDVLGALAIYFSELAWVAYFMVNEQD